MARACYRAGVRLVALVALTVLAACRAPETSLRDAAEPVAPPSASPPGAPSSSPPGAPSSGPPGAQTSSTSTAAQRRYDVVLVAAGDVLNVRASASPKAEVVQAVAPSTRGLRATGREALVAGTRWVELETPAGPGWAHAGFLVEVVRTSSLALDVGVGSLLAGLSTTLAARGDLTPWVSPRGLYVDDYGKLVRFPPEALATLLSRGPKRAWSGPACGEACREGTFADVIARPLLDVLRSPRTTRATDRVLRGGNASADQPASLAALRFVSLFDPGTPAQDHLDWRAFTLYVEPVEGALRLVAIVPDAWSP